MNYAQLLYAMRAACRGWVALSDARLVPPDVVRQLARDMLALLDYNAESFHDARVNLLSQRPLTKLDQCVYATVEFARSHLLRRHEIVDAIAHNAILFALAEAEPTELYLVDLLTLFPVDMLSEARTHLTTRVMMRERPQAFKRALEMLDERVSPPGDLAPLSPSDHHVSEESEIDDT